MKTDISDLKIDNWSNLIQNVHKLTMKSNFVNIIFDFMRSHMSVLAELSAPCHCIYTACQILCENWKLCSECEQCGAVQADVFSLMQSESSWTGQG